MNHPSPTKRSLIDLHCCYISTKKKKKIVSYYYFLSGFTGLKVMLASVISTNYKYSIEWKPEWNTFPVAHMIHYLISFTIIFYVFLSSFFSGPIPSNLSVSFPRPGYRHCFYASVKHYLMKAQNLHTKIGPGNTIQGSMHHCKYLSVRKLCSEAPQGITRWKCICQ